MHMKLSKLAAKEIGVKKAFKPTPILIPTSFTEEIGFIKALNESIFNLNEHNDSSIVSTSKTESFLDIEYELRGKEDGF